MKKKSYDHLIKSFFMGNFLNQLNHDQIEDDSNTVTGLRTCLFPLKRIFDIQQ